MASMASPPPAGGQPGHRRNKSSSMLKSIMTPKAHRRSPSDGTALSEKPHYLPNLPLSTPLLPPDHPHSANPAPQRKSQDAKEIPIRTLHKKTKSSLSLRSLGKDKNKSEPSKQTKQKASMEQSRSQDATEPSGKPQKIKSSTNLASMFQKSKSSRELKKAQNGHKDKENTTPPSTADPVQMQTPIWAQFSSRPGMETTTTSRVPLNDRRSIEEEIALYTPTDYSPSKQRNFFEYEPSLRKPGNPKERPKSTGLPTSSSATSFLQSLSRKMSSDRTPLSATKGNETRRKEEYHSQAPMGPPKKPILSRISLEERRPSKQSQPDQTSGLQKKGNRVMAAVAAFNNKSREVGPNVTSMVRPDPEAIEADFEAILNERNIGEHQRACMRTVQLEVKANFVRTHKQTLQSGSRATSAHSSTNEKIGNLQLTESSKSRTDSQDDPVITGTNTSDVSAKRTRPRSRTFTFSKSDSPTKKQKAQAAESKSSRSAPIPKSPSSRSLASTEPQKGALSSAPESSTPAEFVQYFRKFLAIQEVEVGRLQKLRQLLRNETVDWVNAFIEAGGMTELVNLLHRIMAVEWREEHEDTLLHESLRALKGLCTTDFALEKLREIAPTLFPALLAMLFDEEHKGPSEFTTRELIISLLFVHLSSASEKELPSRARELLAYLKDPIKEKQSSTIPFILQMHQPRPYQVWCKEITNVTKEVFWIFIHHLNVIPLPSGGQETESKSYAKAYFPGPRAIVPAAPYVGGVEWDATNYIATHVDLLNGLIASLPNQQERNNFRSELKASGFEKLMGQLRACNPKYYGAVHDSVKVWIGAALEDGWDVKPVRMGSGDGRSPGSPVKSPNKSPNKKDMAPKLDAPKVDLGLGLDVKKFSAEGFAYGAGPAQARVDDDWF